MSRVDYEEFKNREKICQEVISLKNDKATLVLIRILAYMQVGNHKDRQDFWSMLEKYLSEYAPAQLTIDEVVTGKKTERYPTLIERVLDKGLRKI